MAPRGLARGQLERVRLSQSRLGEGCEPSQVERRGRTHASATVTLAESARRHRRAGGWGLRSAEPAESDVAIPLRQALLDEAGSGAVQPLRCRTGDPAARYQRRSLWLWNA